MNSLLRLQRLKYLKYYHLFKRQVSISSTYPDILILSAVRTPIGSFRQTLSPLSAPRLGAYPIREAVSRSGLSPSDIEGVYMGCVLSGGTSMNPGRQVSIYGGLPTTTDALAFSKGCASGIKAVMFAANDLKTGCHSVMVAGGMESMSNVPYFLRREDPPYGGVTLLDGIMLDGLLCPHCKISIGHIAEITAKKHSISRDQQDQFALDSYQKTAAAVASGVFKDEVIPVTVPETKGKPEVVMKEDEEYKRLDLSKISSMPTPFQKEGGTVTSANCCGLNDGAAALVIATDKAAQRGTKPLARIIGYQDAAADPVDYAETPSLAMAKLLQKCAMNKDDVTLWEINESFAVVALLSIMKIGMDPSKVNIHGGSVALGHPFAMSGARLLCHLCHNLKPGEYGVAASCSGGASASSMLIQRL